MSVQHAGLAEGRWGRISFPEQMAHIGSEVSRALHWRKKNNDVYCRKAFERCLELIDLTLDVSSRPSQYKELARLREALVDYFFGANEFSSTPQLWERYFNHFNVIARSNT